jgi:hypothetical protein
MNAVAEKVVTNAVFIPQSGRVFTVRRRDNFADQATFRYEDDVWPLLDVLKPNEVNSKATIVFDHVAGWLRETAKQYILHLWLETSPTANRLVQAMVAIRHLGKLLPDFKGRPIDLRMGHAREFTRRFCEFGLSNANNANTCFYLNDFAAFVRRQHPEVKGNNFIVVFPKQMTSRERDKPLEQSQEARISTDVLAAIVDACTADLKAYYDAKANYLPPLSPEYQRRWRSQQRLKRGQRVRMRSKTVVRVDHYHARAIKAQAVILAICVGRRASAICHVKADVRTERLEWLNDAGQQEKGVLVRFREMKIRNIDEDVACPDAFGELALRAIETAKELTADLRRDHPHLSEFLFLVPNGRKNGAKILTTEQINGYINGFYGYGKGIRQRYNIACKKITTHNFRHTRATNAWIGGLQAHEVSQDLGHVCDDMAIRHYIIGSEESKRRYQSLMDHGALSGRLEEFVGGREMVQTRLGRRHVEIMRRQGRVVSPTRYGYCALHASSGPCTRTTPCYLGPGVADGGCDHHILSPDALPALEEDREVLEANIATYGDDQQYRVWVDHQQLQLQTVYINIERAKGLQENFNGCKASGCGGCNRKVTEEGGRGDGKA